MSVFIVSFWAGIQALLLILSHMCVFIHGGAIPYKPCPLTNTVETRSLYVATCDSRGGWKEFMALRTWNVTGYELRRQHNVPMINVCKDQPWKGFLTKPTLYLAYLKTLPLKNEKGGDTHAILMDADTFWATDDLNLIWNKYDCARNGKDLLLSTEMSCWIGRYCRQEDLYRYYNHTKDTPSYSPYVNSGIVMGKIATIIAMLEYVIEHNKDYYIEYFKLKFDDQYAYADYALKIAPDKVGLDYHQQLLASFSIHHPGDPYEDGWPFACRARDGDDRWKHLNNNCPSCPNWTVLLSRHQHFITQEDKCHVQRRYWDKMPLEAELKTLAPDPVIWHGNGVGKKSFYNFGHQAWKCSLTKRNFTEQQYIDTMCC